MAYNSTIDGFACGNDLDIIRNVVLPSGVMLSKAVFTVKARERDIVPLVVKTIYTAMNHHGEITTVSGMHVLLFTVSGEESKLFTPNEPCSFWIRVESDIGKEYTPEKGTIYGVISDY